MPFKIVQTVEDEGVCLAVVPSDWEINGILWWPPAPVNNVTSKEYSKPKQTWLKYSCVVKRVFEKYDLAVEELKKMEGQTDTEDEEAIQCNPYENRPQQCDNFAMPTSTVIQQLNRLPATILQQQNNNTGYQSTVIQENYRINSKPNTNIQYTDFNNLVLLAEKAPPPPSAVTPPAPPPLPSSQPLVSGPNIDNLIGPNISLNDVSLDNSFMITPQNDNATILQNQRQIMELLECQKENITKIMSQLGKHEIILGELYNKIAKLEHNQVSFFSDQNNTLFERFTAVKTIEELNELEEKLKNQSFRQRYIDSMSILCSEGTGLKGINLCYKMVDFFVTRDVFLECSWTGHTRENIKKEKRPFKFYENVRSTFLAIIRTADSKFSQLQCDEFFKRIIKNSKQRFEAATKPVDANTHKHNSRKRLRIKENSENDQSEESREVEQSEKNRETEQLEENGEAEQPENNRQTEQSQENEETEKPEENIEAAIHPKENREAVHEQPEKINEADQLITF